MTNIFDRRTNVRELQMFLRTFSRLEGGIPLINPDGIFGAETTAAVRDAQRKLGLAETGSADLATWEALFAIHSRRRI